MRTSTSMDTSTYALHGLHCNACIGRVTKNLLPLADGRQRDRAIVLTQSQINHGSDRKTAFSGESHCKLLFSGPDLRGYHVNLYGITG